MNTLYKKSQSAIVAALFALGMLVGGAVVSAQNEDASVVGARSEANIAFPIAELGSCTDKASCKIYCDIGEHMEECVAFALAHGLMNKDEASRATKFAGAIKQGTGPGGCTDPGSCKTYCEDVSHLEACVAFAEKQGFKGHEFEQGKKLSAFVRAGGTMPGGCTSKSSCQAYCGDLSHAEECAVFAQKSGMADEMSDRDMHAGEMGGPRNMPTPEQLRMLAELAQKGGTPGGCTTKDACEAYCHVEGHFDECMAFGEKVGFIKKDEAERMKKMMSEGGPGGCKSPQACHAYCNEEVNRETCFTFAQENGLIPPEEIERMKEGMVRMRQGIENAPAEVVACLKSTLGTNIIEDIQSGKFVPGPGTGEKMRACFERFGGTHNPTEIFNNAPPEVMVCLEEKLGANFAAMKTGELKVTPEMADSFRVCFQQMEMDRGEMEGGPQGLPDAQKLQGFLRSAPPEVAACLKEKLGEEYEKISQGTSMLSPEMGQTMRGCFEQFRSQMMPQNGGSEPVQGGMQQGQQHPQVEQGTGMPQMPPEVMACLKEKLGEEGFLNVEMSPKTPAMEASVRACFEQYGGVTTMPPPTGPNHQIVPMEQPPTSGTWVNGLPLSVQTCLQMKLGVELVEKMGFAPPTPEIEMAIKACFAEAGGAHTVMPPPTGEMLPPPPMDGTLPPPLYNPEIQSRKNLGELLLGAVAAPFANLWELVN